MKTFTVLAFLPLLWLTPATASADDACSAVRREVPSLSSEELNGCVCDSRPKNLRNGHTLPFRIVAACNLRWNPGKPFDPVTRGFQPEEKNLIDTAYGSIIMSGEATLEGRLQADEMGRVILYLDQPLMLGDVVYKVSSLEVGMPPKNILVIPEHLRHLSCLDGRATVTVKDLFMNFSDIVTVSSRTSVFRKATLDKLCSD